MDQTQKSLVTKKNKNRVILKVTNLSKRFSTSRGVVDAVKDVSFEVREGDFFGIIGESGSGKTTLGRTIIGLHKSTHGSVYFDDELINVNLSREKKKWKQKNVQMIFQDPLSSLNEKKNVLSIISEPLRINRGAMEEFYTFWRLNKEIQKNFRYTLLKKYIKAHDEFEIKLHERALYAYQELLEETNEICDGLDQHSSDDLIEFIEATYYPFLIRQNNKALKQHRKLLTYLDDTYEETVSLYKNNQLEEDEIVLKNLKEKLEKINKVLKQKYDPKMWRQYLEQRKICEENKIKLQEGISFTKNFIGNFKQEIRILRKENKVKAMIETDLEKHNLINRHNRHLDELLELVKVRSKNIIFAQSNIDKTYKHKKIFFKIDHTDENFGKSLESVKKEFDSCGEVYATLQAKIEDDKNKLNEISAGMKGTINPKIQGDKKVQLLSEKTKIKSAIKKADEEFRDIAKRVKEGVKAWLVKHKITHKEKVKQLKSEFKEARKLTKANYKKILKRILTLLKSERITSINNVKEAPAQQSQSSTLDIELAKELPTIRDNVKAIKLSSKVKKQNFVKSVTELLRKRRAVEIETKLEEKEVQRMHSIFGLSILPRFIQKVLARRTYIINRVKEMLVKVGLKVEHAYRYPHEFSGGQRQRIGIARAIITKPKLIIADEPISALDVSIQAQVVNILRDLSKEFKCTLLFIAHDLSMISYICDEVIIMSSGRVLEKGLTKAIFDKPVHPYTRELLSSVPELSNVHKDLVESIDVEPYIYNNNEEYPFVKVSKDNHYILANEKQAKKWL